MQIQSVHSLRWLSRWYNGRAERFARLHDQHTTRLEQLVRDRLGDKCYRYQQALTICGIEVVATCTPQQVVIHHVGSEAGFVGWQHELFSLGKKRQAKPNLIAFRKPSRRSRPSTGGDVA